MKMTRFLAALVVGVLALAQSGWAQEKTKPPEESKPITPLKVQVVLSEFEGEKKISSLPYVLFVNADDRGGNRETRVRMGIRIPVVVATKDSPSSLQYLDVGADLDCSAQAAGDGRFRLSGTVRKSSAYSSGPEKRSLDWNPGDAPLSSQPIVRQFSTTLSLLVRDGQTIQSTVATDPVSGRVLKVDVTVNVVK